jgi:hypothetical protein
MARHRKSREAAHTEPERRHRGTPKHADAVAMMAAADFDAAPPLAVAMGLCTAEEYEELFGKNADEA